MKVLTLEQHLSSEKDYILLGIYTELASGVVPDNGRAHEYVRMVNDMIKHGEMCISTNSYRKVYLPTFAKLVMREMAARYAKHLAVI